MTNGQLLALWTVRLAALFYVASLYHHRRPDWRTTRWLWTVALVFYVTHVISAFQYFYGWSHTAAYRETARQTAAMFGVSSGVGLYLNYLFTAVWTIDAIWWWSRSEQYQSRPFFVSIFIHGFLAFMFFNATVVFGKGAVRWAGITVTLLLLLVQIRTKFKLSPRQIGHLP